MLIMVLLGLLIPLGVGALALMELKAPPHTAVAVVQPLAETDAGISDSHHALAKADRLEITAASSETPAQPAPVDERISPPEGITIGRSAGLSKESGGEASNLMRRPVSNEGTATQPHPPASSEPPRVINRPRHDPKPKKVATAALAKPKPKVTDTKRTAISERSKGASDTEPCRLSAFGGLRKALNSADCEI